MSATDHITVEAVLAALRTASEVESQFRELQARYNALWEAQDAEFARFSAEREAMGTLARENETLRATVEKLTRRYDEAVRPPADDCTPELKPCPLCGFAAWEANRSPTHFEIQCGRWRNAEAAAEMECSVATGSYRTAEEAREVWARRAR